jgi:hypothetical protein
MFELHFDSSDLIKFEQLTAKGKKWFSIQDKISILMILSAVLVMLAA